jgi:opacity protein-like surface antigen
VLKGLFFGSVAVLTASSYAIAADPSATMPLKAAQTSYGVPSSYDWSGFYVGGHLGQAWGRSNWLEAPDMISGSFSLYEPFDAFQTTGSIFAGLQAGYDYVLPNRLVVGAVTEVSAPSNITQPIHKSSNASTTFGIIFGGRHQHSDPPHTLCLLRARPNRPRDRCGPEERDEFAAGHSMTSSARASSVAGAVRPSAFAAPRFMMNSYFVGCCTGRLPAFSPHNMRST